MEFGIYTALPFDRGGRASIFLFGHCCTNVDTYVPVRTNKAYLTVAYLCRYPRIYCWRRRGKQTNTLHIIFICNNNCTEAVDRKNSNIFCTLKKKKQRKPSAEAAPCWLARSWQRSQWLELND